MKKIVSFAVLIVVLCFLCACPSKPAIKNYQNFFPVIVDAAYKAPSKHQVHIDSAYIDKNILNLKVNYTGGCKPHFFEMYSSGVYAKSKPPQVSVFIYDTVTVDNCRQFKEEFIKFDLSKLKHSSQKEVKIKLDAEKIISYSY